MEHLLTSHHHDGLGKVVFHPKPLTTDRSRMTPEKGAINAKVPRNHYCVVALMSESKSPFFFKPWLWMT